MKESENVRWNHLGLANCFWDTRKFSGTILNSKVALTARWTSLTGARRRSREGRLAGNVIVMAFVISISRRVLKHGALNGGISVNLGHNTLPINPPPSPALIPTADRAVCLSLPSGCTLGPRGYSNDSLFLTKSPDGKYEITVIVRTHPANPLEVSAGWMQVECWVIQRASVTK